MPAILNKENIREEQNPLKLCCPLCRARDSHILFVRNEEQFAECRACHLVFRNPQPTPEENQKYFEAEYYDSLGDLNADIQKARRNSLFLKVLQECQDYRKSGRLLDVGSGYGDFLQMAQDAGWEAWGIEPSRAMAQGSQKEAAPKILNTTVEATDFPPDYFDIITLWNVVDYLSDPVSTLRKVSRWLSPQGVLILRVPNAAFHAKAYRFYARLSPFLKRMGWRKDPSVFHSVNFSSKPLKQLLLKAGFSGVEIANAEPTQGDPYQVLSHSLLTQAVKSFLYGVARSLSFLSWNRIFSGPSLVAHVYKTNLKLKSKALKTMQARIFLKRVVLHSLACLGYLLCFPLWFKLLGKHRDLRILLYHSVDAFKKGDMNVRTSEFEKQLDFLKNRFAVTSLAEALQSLDQGQLPDRPSVAITFDDGYENNYYVVYPLLRKKAFPAAIFLLTSGKENRKTGHLGDDYVNDSKLLEWEQIREMSHSDLITFGSHGQTHQRLKSLQPEKLIEEITLSKEKIESEVGRPALFFSYPYGTYEDFDRKTEDEVRQAGYTAAFSAMFGTNASRANRFALRRIGIEASDTLFTFRAKLNGALSLLALFNAAWFRKLIRKVNLIFLSPPSPRLSPLRGERIKVRGKQNPILLVSVDFPPHTDGVSTISRELSIRIAEKGKSFFVIGPQDKNDAAFDAGKPYRIFRVPGYHWGYLRFVPILFSMPWTVFRHGIRKIFAMNIAYGGILSWLLSFICPLEYVLFAYGYEFEKVKHKPFAKGLYREIYAKAKGIVCCSQAVRDRLIAFGVEPQKISVLYPAVDFKRYRPLPVPREFIEKNQLAGRRIILTVGRLVERKGQDQVLKALPQLAQQFPEILYCIVGKGEYENELRKIVQGLKLENHVRFMGWVPGDNILYLYNACEIFIMPSREIKGEGNIEGFGIVYLEASACAKPVIGGRSGGVLEAIQDGKTGFLVDPASLSDIAEKLSYLLTHPSEAREMGKAGCAWVHETFHWEPYVKQAYQLLTDEDLV